MSDTRYNETVAPENNPNDTPTVNLRGPKPDISVSPVRSSGESAEANRSPRGDFSSLETIDPSSCQPAEPDSQPISGYEILTELGRGAMGVVYKARDVRLNRLVALKMILSGTQAGSTERVRFQIEAEAVARLSHPNIVQLYKIDEYNGQPYFALEFCEGGTLSGKLEDGAFSPRQAAEVVEQLARGMEAAHRAGVIHRDLKPANVLLTGDGTPKITDFGLARKIDTSDDSRATQAGAIMGTPSYMPPEQAAGLPAGPTADIYSLGAILYDLLTGSPPFKGKTVLETLVQVKTQEPPPPSRLMNTPLPRDLETICLKCLHKDPVRRYPSAGELADDLRAYLTGRPISARPTPLVERAWMWSRRNPAAAGLTAMAVALGLVVLIGAPLVARNESIRATREAGLRDRAELNFRAAQEAVDTMMTRIAEERLEFDPKLEELRRDVLNRAVQFYDQFLDQAGDDAQTRRQTALALSRVAMLRGKLGQRDEAEEAYRRAVALLDQPEDERRQAAVQMDLARLRRDPALYRQAIATLEKQSEHSPSDEDLALDLATARGGLAMLLVDVGQRSEATDQLTAAVSRLHSSNGVAQRRELARLLGSLAQLRREAGDSDRVRPLLDDALGTYRALSALTSDDRYEMALLHDRLGDLSRATQPTEAIRWYQEAVALASALVADYPSYPNNKKLLAQTQNNLGLALLAAGKPGAEAALRDSLATKQLLANTYPRDREYRRNLASASVNHAVLMQTNGRTAEAETAYALAADLLTALNDIGGAARARTNQGVALQSLGRHAEAEKAYRSALAQRGDLPQDATVEQRFEASRTRFLLATLLQMMGQLEESERLHRAALAAYRTLPNEPDYVLALCSGMNNLADLLRATQRSAEGIELWQESRVTLAALTQKQPRPLYAQEEARTLHNLGATYTQTGKLKEGLRAHESALAIRLRLVSEQPQEPAYRQELASTYGEMGITHGTANRLDRAVESFRQAIDTIRALTARLGERPEWLNDELNYQTNLSGVLKATGDEGGAKKCNARIATLKKKLGMS